MTNFRTIAEVADELVTFSLAVCSAARDADEATIGDGDPLQLADALKRLHEAHEKYPHILSSVMLLRLQELQQGVAA